MTGLGTGVGSGIGAYFALKLNRHIFDKAFDDIHKNKEKLGSLKDENK